MIIKPSVDGKVCESEEEEEEDEVITKFDLIKKREKNKMKTRKADER